jgi:hypothetical protein
MSSCAVLLHRLNVAMVAAILLPAGHQLQQRAAQEVHAGAGRGEVPRGQGEALRVLLLPSLLLLHSAKV